MSAPKAGKNFLAEVANKPGNWNLSASRLGSQGGPSAEAAPPTGIVPPPVPALPRAAAAIGYPAAPAPAAPAAPPVPVAGAAAGGAGAAAAGAPANIGAGSFGVVLSPALNDVEGGVIQKFPANVSKVFFSKRKFDAALNHLRKVPAVMGVNNGHRFHTYKKAYKGSNLPAAMQSKYGLSPNAPLYLIRMPNLGKDIDGMDVYLPMLRKVHILTIIQQIVKVLGQVDKLQESGYVHGDIREMNVMVKPDGTLTIIDFDWLLPKEEFFERFLPHMGFYSTPPETLVFEAVAKRLRNYDHVHAWARRNARYYPHYFAARGMGADDIYNAVLATAYPEAIDEVRIVDGGSYSAAYIPMLFPFFDTYAIATTLLEFLTKLYGPTILRRESNAAGIQLFANDLRALGVKEGEDDYSDAHIRFCAAALLGMIKVVLLPLADLSRRRRLAIGSFAGRYALAGEFARMLQMRLTASAVAAPPAAAPAAPAPAAPAPRRNYSYNRHNRYAGEVPFSGNTSNSGSHTNSSGGARRRRTLRRKL